MIGYTPAEDAIRAARADIPEPVMAAFRALASNPLTCGCTRVIAESADQIPACPAQWQHVPGVGWVHAAPEVTR